MSARGSAMQADPESSSQTFSSDVPPKPIKMGRPRLELTPSQIEDLERLAEAGATRHEMAAMLGMCPDTLFRRLRERPDVHAMLERAGAKLRTSLRRKQVQVALTDGHPAQATMLIWCGKVICGQTDRITLKIETQDDAFAKLKEIWPELSERELKQLVAGAGDGTAAEPIDAEVV